MQNRQTNSRNELCNGVNVTALMQTIDAVRHDAGLADFRFRARNRWLGGDRNRSTIEGFYGAGQEQAHGTPFVLDNAEPPVLIGGDRGANPVEHLLNALAGCLTTSLVYHAAARGIVIGSVESELEGDLDVRGFMGLSEEVRKGYRAIRVRMRVETDAPVGMLETLARFSPVYDVVSRSVPVALQIETC